MKEGRRPIWVAIVAIACILPLGLYPAVIGRVAPESALLVKLYPAYVLASGWLAWLCWPRRREMYWILLALLLLSHVAMWLLTKSSEITT